MAAELDTTAPRPGSITEALSQPSHLESHWKKKHRWCAEPWIIHIRPFFNSSANVCTSVLNVIMLPFKPFPKHQDCNTQNMHTVQNFIILVIISGVYIDRICITNRNSLKIFDSTTDSFLKLYISEGFGGMNYCTIILFICLLIFFSVGFPASVAT